MNYGQTFLLANSSNFPSETIPLIQKEINQLDDQAVNTLMATEIKNPTTGLLLALFLGEWGADRFYSKDTGLAIGKLALTILGILTSFIGIGLILLLAVYIWKIVDCCLIMGAIKQGNVERLLFNIQQIKVMSQGTAPVVPATPTAIPATPAPAALPEAPVSEEVAPAVEAVQESVAVESVAAAEAAAVTEAVEAPEAPVVAQEEVAPVAEVAEQVVVETAESLSEEAPEAVLEVAEETVVEEVSAVEETEAGDGFTDGAEG